MQYPVYRTPPLLTNKVRPTPFRPLDSAVRGARGQTFFEQWLRNVPPKLLGSRRRIVEKSTLTYYRNQDFEALQQVTLPYPMQVAIFTTTWRDGEDAQAPNLPSIIIPDRRVFRTEIVPAGLGTIPSWAGCYLVEWGVGEMRNYVILDLAQNSLNLPLAQWVKVSAQIIRHNGNPAQAAPPAICTASIVPNHQQVTPWATVTHQVFSTNFAGPARLYKFPHAREFFANLYTVNANVYWDVRIQTKFNNTVIRPVASYRITPPYIGAGFPQPSPAPRYPLPIGVDFIDLYPRAYDGVTEDALELVQTIEP